MNYSSLDEPLANTDNTILNSMVHFTICPYIPDITVNKLHYMPISTRWILNKLYYMPILLLTFVDNLPY